MLYSTYLLHIVSFRMDLVQTSYGKHNVQIFIEYFHQYDRNLKYYLLLPTTKSSSFAEFACPSGSVGVEIVKQFE